MGRTYEIAVFRADRHPTESNYQLTLSGFPTTRSNCMPTLRRRRRHRRRGVRLRRRPTPSSDPLCAGKINDGSYGGCTAECKYGPYCGDGMVTRHGEECDLGSRMNTMTYGTKDGCAPGCKFPHFCGDGNVDEAEGEQCDLGHEQRHAGAPCTNDCKVCVDCL